MKKSNANSQQEREKCQPRKGTVEKVNPIIGEPPEIFRFFAVKKHEKIKLEVYSKNSRPTPGRLRKIGCFAAMHIAAKRWHPL